MLVALYIIFGDHSSFVVFADIPPTSNPHAILLRTQEYVVFLEPKGELPWKRRISIQFWGATSRSKKYIEEQIADI